MKFTSADLLNAMGLKVGDKIKTKHNSELEVIYDSVHCVYLLAEPQKEYEFRSVRSIESLTNVDFEILVQKQKLSDAERAILENLPKVLKYILREENLIITEELPYMKNGYLNINGVSESLSIYNHLFKFIKREDEPYEIKELLK